MELQGDLAASVEVAAATSLPSSVAGAVESAPNSSSPPLDVDLLAAGSFKNAAPPEPRALSSDDDVDQQQEPDNGHGDQSSVTGDLSADDLKHKIVKQVEYYFSDENLPTDKFLLGFVKKNKEGHV